MELAQWTASLKSHDVRSLRPDAPPTVEAIYATGHWLLGRDRPEEAARVFRCMLHVAPRDERAWLGLGECHERIGQPRIALELFGVGTVVASPSVRCWIGRARVLGALDRDDEAEQSLEIAERLAEQSGDDALVALVTRARSRAS